MDTYCSHISALRRGTVRSGMDRHWDWHGRVWHGQAPQQLRIGPSIVARFELEYSAVREPRRVRVFPGNPNRIVVNELGLGPLSADEKRMALQCVSFLPVLSAVSFLPQDEQHTLVNVCERSRSVPRPPEPANTATT